MSSAHHHHHDGHHHVHTSNKKVLRISLWIIAIYMMVEVIGGLWTGSLALLSDAGHMFSDAFAIGLSLLAFQFAERASNSQNTFGYKRAEILAAALNGITLIVIAVLIIIEAIRRFYQPPEIATVGMLLISFIGLVVNIVIAVYMHRQGDTEQNVNMRSAYLHVLGDLLGSVGAIIAALLMMFFDWRLADPLVSVMVALLIARSAYGILKSTFPILMEAAPSHINQQSIVEDILNTEGIQGIHDLHVWTLTGQGHYFSAHLVVEETLTVVETSQIIHQIEAKLKDYGILHSTLQVEGKRHQHSETLYCDGMQNHQHHAPHHTCHHH
ncbi:cation diffusion facilitator family transporter [Pelistega ratti]|uniref:cation diffusion facilitator family transporter n=1 Tax=Pelistega ratti TaxID=2652177 RepID=UPI00135890D1|nr:cation diffusion facilitator family transporter [Pelistega ratti]